MPVRQRKKKTAEPKPPKEKLITRSTIMSDYGWTATLIKKYLPPPQLKTNPNYHTAAPMQLWPESLVLETMMTPEFQTDFLKLQDSRNVQKQREEEKKQRVRDVLMQYDLNALILKARTLDRHFVLHYGPTNSGKTYQSIEALKKARSGVYLGPLRLLALEVFDTLNDAGVACSLLTGEESIEVPSAGITASTIEMLNTNRRYDVAVIDEAQIIADRDRGGAWTKAILAVNAKEVHLCFAPEALDFYKLLLHDCETDYEVVEHKRLTPLVYSGSVKALSCVSPGDCFVCFSRRTALNISATLEKKYHVKASVIYGALPPASRREEIRKFASGQTSVVVATDAIGMGVSLPIKRIIFCETTKFDGIERRPLTTGEVNQIAGRAGRYGKFDKGEVLVVGSSTLIQEKLNQPTPPISKIVIPFPNEVIESGIKLSRLLSVWQEPPESQVIAYEDVSEPLELLKALGPLAKQMTPEQVFNCIRCPVDTQNAALVNYWYFCCAAYAKGTSMPFPVAGTDTLEDCELRYKQFDVLHQMMRRCGVELDTSEARKTLCKQINKLLKEKRKNYGNECRICGEELPLGYRYSICKDCYESGRFMRY